MSTHISSAASQATNKFKPCGQVEEDGWSRGARFVRFWKILGITAGLVATLGSWFCPAQVNVLMQHNDMGRTGQNTSETLLTTANVNSSTFGQLFTLPVDGQVYAQPMYMSALQIPGSGTHNVVFVATEHDSVYAFDADSNGGADASPLWQASMLTAAHGAAAGATTVPYLGIGQDIIPEYGITGTPVIDPVAGVLYCVSFTLEGSSYILRLHALSITTGAEMPGSPIAIQAQTAGTGNGSSGGIMTFDPKWENQRPGLLLLNGILYIGFGSHADNGPWHGWLLSYNPSTLAQIGTYCTSANGTGSGIWMSGDGLAADVVDPVGHPFGRMFVSTGNGDYNATTPYTNSMDYGDSILNFDLTNGTPTVQDEFTPYNQATLDAGDVDLGSGGVVVLPNQTGTYPHLLLQEGKGGTIYLVNRDEMSGYNTSDQVVQEVQSAPTGSGVWGGPAYWNGSVYVGESHSPITAYSLAGGVLSTAPTSTSPETYSYPGLSASISSNGTTNGILWAIDGDAYASGGISVLKAYNASNLANELYTSAQVPARDSAGPAVHLVVPTIANGKVYVGAGGVVDVYGLLSSEPQVATPVFSPGSSTFNLYVQVTITDATPGAVIYYTIDGTAPSTASTVYTGPITVNTTETITAIAVAAGYVWQIPASATFTSLDNTANPVFSPAAGTYSTSPTVTIFDASAGAVIYYTTDGTVPTMASTQYIGPITGAGTETLRAIAFATGLSGSSVVSATYTTQSQVDFSQGFSLAQTLMKFNGTTGLDDSRLQLTNGYSGDNGSAFVTTPLNIQAFTTNFLFQLSNPEADGITFTIQGSTPSALGTYSDGLGYAGIPTSLAIKFDFYNDAGEGNDSTGVYINGAVPTIPAINLSNTGINLLSGDTMAAQITYDGTNLGMTITDQVTSASWSAVWQENIPQIVGGNTAYVGFTGSTQALTASQKIATWTYSAATPGQPSSTATPVISPGTGTYSTPQLITITDATPGAVIYYSTNGTAVTTSSNVYSGPFTISASETLQVMAIVPGGALSGMATANYTLETTSVSYPSGFTTAGLALNGGATVNGSALQLTDGGLWEARSAYFTTAVNVDAFTTSFDFQITNAVSDGFTFVIQNQGLTALGSDAGGLGYGLSPTTGKGASIADSVAVKFDIHNNSGEGPDSTGVFEDGASPTVPATNLTPTGVVLASGHEIHAQIVYDGTNLTLTLTDTVTSATATEAYPVNIPSIVGGNTAYVGFTGGSGGAGATQNILDWTYTPIAPLTTAPAISLPTGTYFGTQTVTITDATPGAVIYFATNGTTPNSSSTVYSGAVTISSTATLQAIAIAPGWPSSGVTASTLTIDPSTPSYGSGFVSPGLALNGGATVNGSALQLTDGGLWEARSAYFTTAVNVDAFTTSFDFQITNAVSDGFTFVIQNQGLTALGSDAGGLGYGLSPTTGKGASIADSVAVKFDIHNNSGEGPDSTGVFEDGASPTVPATNLTPTGVVLASGHEIHAQIVYDGTNLTLTLTDTVTSATATEAYPVNIPSIVGGNTAYVGFTGGSGGAGATQNILDWTYTSTTR